MNSRNDNHANLSPQQKRELVAKLLREKASKQDVGISQLFEQQVARKPDAVACYFEERQLTYAELNSKANQLAHYLRAQGIGPDRPVGIYLERSPEFLVALLAIFKVGGTYVSIDLAYPVAYVERILKNAGLTIVITRASLKNAVIEIAPSCSLQCLDDGEFATALGTYPVTNPSFVAHPDSLAQLAYTSGSTGEPKAVMVTQRQIINWLYALWGRMPFGPDEVVAQKTNAAFVVSLKEMLAGLLAGAPQVIISDAAVKDPHSFIEALQRWRITRLNIVPSHLQALLENLNDSAATALRTLKHCITAGEPLSQATRHLVQSALPWVNLWNNYGCTELNDTMYCNPDEQDSSGIFVPMGRPIANTRVYVLNEALQQMPVGVSGELCVDSIGISRGYWHSPTLTAERFIPNPFSEKAGGCLFRTGDVVRQLADGRMEYLGRQDFQIKIRGQRIETLQVENTIANHPQIDKAIVVGYARDGGPTQLVVYYTTRSLLSGEELQAFLNGKLPGFMIPTFYVRLEAFPTLPNGKLNRLALPAPSAHTADIAPDLVPQHDDEKKLAQLWCEVLDIDQVGMDNDFFASGGHSLSAIKLISRIHSVFDLNLSIRTILENPTLAQQIAYIRNRIQAGLPGNLSSGESNTDAYDLSMPPVVPVARDRLFPLSLYQQRFWYFAQLQPENLYYQVTEDIQISSADFDFSALAAAINEMVRRHELLRTTFPEVDGKPVQSIDTACVLTIPLVDLSHLDEKEARAESFRLAAIEANTPFDLRTQHAIRFCVHRRSASDHLLIMSIHHIAYDLWSIGLIMQEIAALYGAFSQCLPSPLAEPKLQYADFAYWQEQLLQGHVLEKQLAYWTQQLADAPPILNLPTDRPRPSVQTYNGATIRVACPETLTPAIYALARTTGCTPFMILLAAFNVLLYRYSGQDDFCIGTLSANRTPFELETLIGMFVNVLVFRSRINPRQSFDDYLHATRANVLDVYAHCHLPFEMILEQDFIKRDPSYQPVFQVMFTMENEDVIGLNGNAQSLDLEKKQWQFRSFGETKVSTHARFDLTVTVQEANSQLYYAFEYNTDLFNGDSIERMMAHYHVLLDTIVAAPETLISNLPLLTRQQQEQILYAWNPSVPLQTTAKQQTIHQQFEIQAGKAPQAIALVFENQRLTYGELNSRANQLAHHLRNLGVGPDVLVALCVERSIDMIVGILGILKAGGAYVPLDPAYPQDRLQYMLSDAKPAVILTQSHLREALPANSIATCCLDADWHIVAAQPNHNPDNRTLPGHLAYVIYTSGSTGKPKGVLSQHANVQRLFSATDHWYRFNESDTWTLFHSYAFDFSVWEIWGALLYGGKLVIVPYTTTRSPDLFRSLLVEERVTVLNQTPSAFQQLVEIDRSQSSASPLSLRTVIFGGEALNRAALEPWFQAHGYVAPTLVNMYGITETTVHVSYYPLQAEAQAPSCIGRPIPDLGVYILDSNLNPVPIGVPGELHIAGDGLARGYLNRADLTAEKFIANPFAATPGSRMYKSGDLARYLPDGNIDYLGRIDHQVKMRGFRIELGEIEAVLTSLLQVREAVVLVREDVPGDKRLVAYLVLHDGTATIDAAELRAVLLQSLPDYMVPSHFLYLDKLPLTQNGKIDRKALPKPDISRSENDYVAPRNATEETLAIIWAEVLKLERVGIYDNFFELGGHSLLAMQIFSAVAKRFGRQLPLASLFQGANVETMARLLQSDSNDMQLSRSLIVPLNINTGVLPLFCVHPVGGQIFDYQELAKSLNGRIPVYAVQSSEAAQMWMKSDSIVAMAANYAAAIKTIQATGPYRLAGWSSGGLIALAVASILEQEGNEVGYIGLIDCHQFDRNDTREDLQLKGVLGALRALGKNSVNLQNFNDITDLKNGKGIIDFINENEQNLQSFLPYLKTIQESATIDTLAMLKHHASVAYQHLMLLSDYAPDRVQAPLHAFWAKEILPVNRQSGLDDWKGFNQADEKVISGDHFSMLQQPHVLQLADAIASALIKETKHVHVMPD